MAPRLMRQHGARPPSRECSAYASLLTVGDVACRPSLSGRMVGAWIGAGRIETVRLRTRCVRVEPSAVDRLLEEARQ